MGKGKKTSQRPTSRAKPTGSILIRLSLFLAVVILAIIGVFATYFFSVLSRPAIFKDDVIVIPSGAGAVVISARLNNKGIRHPFWVIQLETLRRGKGYVPKAGEFTLPEGTSLKTALDIFNKGSVIQHSLTFPEGWTSRQILAVIDGDERLSGEVTPLPAEGTMLPETYFFTRGVDRNLLVNRLQEAQEASFAILWSERQSNLPLKNIAEAIVLASIVEKETGRADERPKVASVFINRLRAGMRLQSDPTVLYGLEQAGEGVAILLRRHLKHDSPWNTYQHRGLPPTPIANPGQASMEAVLNPAETEFFYFVADGKGGHRFAKTLAEHQKNVRDYRKIQRTKSP